MRAIGVCQRRCCGSVYRQKAPDAEAARDFSAAKGIRLGHCSHVSEERRAAIEGSARRSPRDELA